MKEFKKGVAGDAEASEFAEDRGTGCGQRAAGRPVVRVLQDADGAGLEPLPPVWRVGPKDTSDWFAEPSLSDGRTPPLHPRA
jgi:hypothetical protein